MLGPTAEDVERKDDTARRPPASTTCARRAARIMPALLEHEVTAVYVGLRAATEHADYQVSIHADEGYACVGGIRSTGLSGSMAIAEHVRGLARGRGPARCRRGRVAPVELHDAEHRRGASRGPTRSRSASRADPDYGRIVCFCERVTRGEIRDAFGSPIPPRRPRRPAPAHARAHGALPGLLLRGRARGARSIEERRVSVAVVGGGPAGSRRRASSAGSACATSS